MAELETVDLEGVEILAVGGPVFGQGSPPGGDFWTTAELRAMAEADAELGDEIKPPAKIGHSDAQGLVLNSDLAPVTPGEMPAVGWLENLRVNDDGTKLLTDIKQVPKTLADLIDAGAYRTRSVELSRVVSQATSKTYEWVVTGLAWLGGKLPAVRTLDDVVKLYEDADLELPDGVRVYVVYAVGDTVWAPGDSFEALRSDLSEALNGPSSGGMISSRWWVRDVSPDGKALVIDWDSADELDGWVVPFARAEDGTVTPAPFAEWTKAAQAWVETAKEYAERDASFSRSRADSRSMPDSKLTDTQRKAYADALGVKPEELTDEQVAAAEALLPAEDPDPKPDPKPDPDAARELEETRKRALDADERSRKLEEELRVERRDNFVNGLVRAGKIEPGQREHLEFMYDASPEKARAYADTLKVDETLVRELGADDDDPTVTAEQKRELEDRDYQADAARRLGIPAEELV